MTNKESPSKSLPSLNQLFTDSWLLFKQVLLNLFILGLINFGIVLGIMLIGIILAVLFGAGAVFSGGGNPLSDPAKLIPFVASLGFVMIIAWVAIIIVSLAIQITTILLLDKQSFSTNKASEKPSVFGLFKQSFAFILPFIGISIVIGLLTAGGFFLLIIPGIVITILLAFSAYELILNNQRGLNPLRRSFYMVASNFWGILGRMALLWLIAFVVFWAFSLLNSSEDSSVSGFFALIQFIFNTLFGWFAVCYTFTLYKQSSKAEPKAELSGSAYKQTRATVSETETRRLTPLVITAVIGWIIGAFVIYASFQAFGLFMESMSKQQQKEQQQRLNIKDIPQVSPFPYGEDQMPSEEEIQQMLRDATESNNNSI